jgi:hypothetical protein
MIHMGYSKPIINGDVKEQIRLAHPLFLVRLRRNGQLGQRHKGAIKITNRILKKSVVF